MKNRWVGLLLGSAMATVGYCGPTGLNFMPITDILGHRQAYVEFSSACSEHQIDPVVYHCGAVQMGLFDRVEFGIDFGFEPQEAEVWNAKVKLFDSKDGKFALSAGLWNCEEDYVEPYAVASYKVGPGRMHFGATHDEATRLLAGFDVPIGKSFYAMGDYMSGNRELLCAGVGCNFEKIPGLTAIVGLTIPVNKSQGYEGRLVIGYTVKF